MMNPRYKARYRPPLTKCSVHHINIDGTVYTFTKKVQPLLSRIFGRWAPGDPA